MSIKSLILQNIDGLIEAKKLYGTKNLLKRVFYQPNDEYLMEADLNGAFNVKPNDKIELKLISGENMPELHKFCTRSGGGGKDPLNLYKSYLKNNYFGFMAQIENEIIGYIWFCNHESDFEFNDPYHSHLTLKEKQIYIFDLFTDPKYRKKGIAYELVFKSFSKLKELGYEILLCHIRSANTPVVIMCERTGFEIKEILRIRRILLFFIRVGNKYIFDKGGHKTLYQFDRRYLKN